MPDIILEIRDITKIFPGVIALNHVNLSIKKGVVHGLVGENGAGKSTLMNILCGAMLPSKGELYIDGEKVNFTNRADSLKMGVGIVFQELSLIPTLSIAENIYANRQPLTRANLVDWKKMMSNTREELHKFGLDFPPDMLVKQLSAANQQLIEIIKAISSQPRILILDEPTSSLTKVEVDLLFKNIKRLRSEGCTIMYISHHLKEIFEVCDSVSVLKDGCHVCDANITDINETFLVRNMVGREIVNMYGCRDKDELKGIKEQKPVLCVDKLRKTGRFFDVSFQIHPGEILGVYGLVGAGRTEVCRGIAGIEPVDGGRIVFEGKEVTIKNTRESIRRGIGYMTEDRKNEGLFLENSIAFNLLSNKIDRYTHFGLVNYKSTQPEIEKSIKDYLVVCSGPEQLVGTLSGGNQQKVLYAEWASIEPKVLMVDEPTRGVDVGAKSEIYRMLRLMAKKGKAILVVSSDLPEVLSISDRVLVMRGGTIAGEVAYEDICEERIVNLAIGV